MTGRHLSWDDARGETAAILDVVVGTSDFACCRDCTACGRHQPERAMRIDAAPLPEYGIEIWVDL